MACNPVSEMFEMLSLVNKFETAVEHNAVMDFDEYVRRFGVRYCGDGKIEVAEDEGKLPCRPFIYVGKAYANSVYAEGRIVCDHCTFDHDDIVSVWGQYSPFGYPQLSVEPYDDERGDGWVWMCLEYVDHLDEVYESPVDMAREVYLNRITGEFEWCK